MGLEPRIQEQKNLLGRAVSLDVQWKGALNATGGDYPRHQSREV